jgi:hypothetical protein
MLDVCHFFRRTPHIAPAVASTMLDVCHFFRPKHYIAPAVASTMLDESHFLSLYARLAAG